jgi:membrane protein DedA with SNARE-associated domain
MEWLTQSFEQFQYVAIALVLFLAGLGVPIPEDIPLIYGGVMSGKGSMNVYLHFVVSMVFIVVGDVSLYMIGRRLARGAGTSTETPSRWQRLASPERLSKVQGFFERYGSWSVFFGRFVAGVRGAVFLTAGMSGFPLARFILLDTLAALLSVPLWIALGYWAGAHWEELLEQAKSYQVYVLGGLVLVIGGVMWVKRRAAQEVEDEIEEELEEDKRAKK